MLYKTLYKSTMNNSTKENFKKLSMFNSLIHSTCISIISILYLYKSIDLETIKVCYVISIYYFIIDYVFVLNYAYLKEEICFFFHHIITSYILYVFIYENNEETELNKIIAQGFTSEIPIIFLNINWFLIKYKKQNTTIFRIFDHLMIITYFLFRICNFTYILIMNYYKYKFIIKLFTIVYFMNCIWFTILLKRFQKNCLKYKERLKKD